MSTEKQPEALQLADEIDACKAEGFVSPVPAELRRPPGRYRARALAGVSF